MGDGDLGSARQFAILIDSQDADGIPRHRHMGPDTGRSRLGGDDRVADLRTEVGAESAGMEIKVEFPGRAEQAGLIVDLAVESDPGLDGEGALEGETGLGDRVVGPVQGQHAAEDAAELSRHGRELGAVTEGDGELLGDGGLDVGDGDGLVRQARGDGLGTGLGAADAVEHDLAVIDR